MFSFTFLSMLAGVAISSVCGLACYEGSAVVSNQIGGIPGIGPLVNYPEAGLLIGLGLIVIGIFFHPNQVR